MKSKKISIEKLLKKEEAIDIEYKESMAGLEPEDLVAFSNSKGGIILIGVKEIKNKKGLQRGQVIGTKIGESVKRKIISKANSCKPKIKVEVFFEKDNKKNVILIKIPEGEDKPYCTGSGTYKIRQDGQNTGMDPDVLLSILIVKEEVKFLKRFKKVGEEISNEIEKLGRALISDIKDLKIAVDEAIDAAQEASDAAQEAAAAAENHE